MTETLDIVITTIGSGSFLEHYDDTLAEDGARLVVIPDRKTPRAFYDACDKARARGADIVSPDVEEQDRLLAKLGVPDLIPYDSDNRRNIGYLLSYLNGSALTVSMDDDNLPIDRPFLDEHRIVLQGPVDHRVVSAADGWFNACDLLDVEPCRVFPRGFPYGPRGEAAELTAAEEVADVRINAGLWLDDPDVDAVTRLAVRPRVTAYRGNPAVLAKDTWCPVNSQNTAIHHDALPAYYFLRMGQPIGGAAVERFGDIFSGYFVAACAKHLDHSVRFGGPLVNHERNEHDLLNDLAIELPAIRFMDELLDWLREFRLDGNDYQEAYTSLSYGLQDFAEQARGRAWSPEARAFLHRSAHLMRTWLTAVRRIDGS
ncbi:hypothetical protein [Streptomyces sp. NBC_01237]|uniref:hypothetical protein n=1 Tax=Streptomyces sp. NBC_01237 TaxID=2903790 RepID=UPI002DDAE390|nr:hypothetical protein [Streptomyces sp. NBC_01237]WRZ70908.1 hypothetical protein OG251_04415 [Streptomyces sp. NBC_01237]